MGSSFHRDGAVYLKERFVIFKEEWVGGRPSMKNVCCDKVEQKSRLVGCENLIS